MDAGLGSLLQVWIRQLSEVRGREAVEPPAEVRALLDRLIAGEGASAEERREAFELLREQPGWLAWFAERIKAGRDVRP